jgi:hypothetical protein
VVPIAGDLTAARFVIRHHYSGSYPSARQRYGLYERGDLVGVAVLSVPANTRTLTGTFPGLDPFAESLDLGRLVLVDAVPANAESYFLARVWELAARTGLRGVVSFSDPVPRTTAEGRVVMPGHVGTIYQASNARYLGRSAARTVVLLPDGMVFSARAASKARDGGKGSEYAARLLTRWGVPPPRTGEDRAAWLRAALARVGRPVRHAGNLRYGFAIGPRRRLVAVSGAGRPYPKRTDPCDTE